MVLNTGNDSLTEVDLTDSFDTAYLDHLAASFTPASIDEAAGQVGWEHIEVLATVRFRPLVDRPNAPALALTAVSLSDQRGNPIPINFSGRDIRSLSGGGQRPTHWLALPRLGRGR